MGRRIGCSRKPRDSGCVPGLFAARGISSRPPGRAGAAGVSAPTGILLIGGEGPNGPVTTTWKSELSEAGVLQKWAPEAELLRPQADGGAAVIGDYVWVYGGTSSEGPTLTSRSPGSIDS